MKNIEVKYNENGKITNVSDNSLHFEQENESLCIKAQLTVDDDKSVRAYIKGPNNNSYVTDAITKDGEYYPLVIRNEYMSKGTLYIGFEVFNDSGYIERYEPLKVYIDGFVNPGNGSSDNVYVVTVDVAEVETLEPDTPAYVENVGTKKDMRLKFGIPQGKQGIQGEPGKDATIKIGTVTTLEPGSKATVINNGTQSYAILNFGIPKGEKGDTGEQGVQGEPGYTPVKGEDYYTPEEQQGFKADILADIDLVLNTKADAKTEDGGFQGGNGAFTRFGGAVGDDAYSEEGGAVGFKAFSITGGAVGRISETITGGAVGNEALSGMGFSGGYKAQVDRMENEEPIDAIQLGIGKNSNPKTLQIYEHTLMNADGTIPEERLTKAKAYTDEKASELSSAITTLEKNLIECTSSGTAINIKDSAEVKPRGLKLYGKTTQGENPSPENPQELISIGDSGSVDVELYGKNLLTAYDLYNKSLEYQTETIDGRECVKFIDATDYKLEKIPFRENTVYTLSMWAKSTIKSTANTTGSILGAFYYSDGTYEVLYIGRDKDWQFCSRSSNPLKTVVAIGTVSCNYTNWLYVDVNTFQLEANSIYTDYEPFKKQSISILTPDGLLGIPVTSGGNYTDENGQQYICDEVDFEREVYIHRLEKIDSYNGEEITTQYMSTTGELSIGATVIYALETPYETPFTDEEVEAYKSITMYKPVTNIFNSDNAQMKVDYVADTKTYIDNKFVELQNAIISTGGNV